MNSEATARVWVTDGARLDELVDVLAAEPRYALDTEFHRERTYYPRVALVQIAWAGGIALIDPLAVDLAPLARVLDGPGLAVVHAAQQDLEVLQRAVGTVPSNLFDTQLAAGFLGYASPSLTNLVQAELGRKVAKGDRLTDWLRRPLSQEQLAYAAADVAHLLALHDRLQARLEALGRLSWALDECELLRLRPVGPVDPDDAWLRLKDARGLGPRSRSVARALAAWRERRAAALDQPVRTVLPDLAVLGLAQRPPRSVEDLRHTRGLDDRHTRGAVARELFEVVERALSEPPPAAPNGNGDELERHLRPAVTLVSAWVSQLARDERLDTALLATRADLVALLRGEADARLARGWRATLVGEGVRHLVEGRAALAFDGRGNLRLVELPV